MKEGWQHISRISGGGSLWGEVAFTAAAIRAEKKSNKYFPVFHIYNGF